MGKKTSGQILPKESLFIRIENYVSKKMKTFLAIQYQHESRIKIFGLPLLSINLGFDKPEGIMRHARGIIAIGAKSTGIVAFGTIIARGLFTLAPICFGGFSISVFSMGIVCISCFGIGIISVSAFAIGYLAVGVVAIGVKCIGIFAIGESITAITGFGKYKDLLYPI